MLTLRAHVRTYSKRCRIPTCERQLRYTKQLPRNLIYSTLFFMTFLELSSKDISQHLWPSKRNRSVSISNVYEGNLLSKTKMYYWLSAFWDCAGFDSAPTVQTPEKYSFWSAGIRIVRKISNTKVWNVAKIISETGTSGTQSPKQVNYIANLQKVCQILWICYLGLNGHKV